MQTDITENGKAMYVKLRGEIDHHTVKDIRERIDEVMFRLKPDLLTLDFSGVTFMDSSGIGLILGRAEAAERFHGRIRLSGVSRSVSRVLSLCGIESRPDITVS